MMRAAAVLALLLGLTVTLAPPTHADPAAPCASAQLDQKLMRVVLELDGTLEHWRIDSNTQGNWGLVTFDAELVRIHPATPCSIVEDIARHEWVHLQQARFYGGQAGVYERYGDRPNFERVAACTTLLMGVERDWYLTPDRPLYSGPCTLADILEAVVLLSAGRVARP